MPSLSAERHLVVHIRDENDNAPIVSRTHYTLSVPENTLPGITVVTLEASDDDVGVNARLTYSLTPRFNRPKMIDVDPDNGNIFVVRHLDFESSDVEQDYEVLVQDGGSPPLSAIVHLTVIIVDINDCSPQFTQSVYVFEVLENCERGTSVGTVLASDSDGWPFNVVRLS